MSVLEGRRERRLRAHGETFCGRYAYLVDELERLATSPALWRSERAQIALAADLLRKVVDRRKG